MPKKPEIMLPPEPSGISNVDPSAMSFNAAWQRATQLQKGMFFFLSVGTVASATLFALGQFFQTRGVQSMLTSRVFLLIAWFFPTLCIWQFALLLKAKRWKWVASVVSLVLLAAVYALDHAFPMPNSAHSEPSTAKTEQMAKQLEPSPIPAQTEQERAEALGKPPITEVRTHLMFDGNIRFPQDAAGSISPERNFRVGEQLFFNYFYKAIGPNPIQVFASSRWIYLEPDVEDKTQQKVVKDFKERIMKEWKTQPKFAKSYTLMYQGEGQFNSAFAHNEEGGHRSITQEELDDFTSGAVRIFVVIQIPYKDSGKWHYLRTCRYLVPPATIPGVWHFCDYFTNSD